MNLSTKRAWFLLACAAVLGIAAVFMFGHCLRRDGLPEPVSTALSRIESLPLGIRQRDIFPLLGLAKADCEMLDYRFQDGKSGLTWSRYQMGSTAFVLECESRIKPYGLEDDVEAGVLQSALIRQRFHDSHGEVRYASLMPMWPKKK